MSLPKFSDNNNLPTREEAINQIIASIAMEELGLSHIINAEGEKLQYALGTIPGSAGLKEPLTLEELLKLNENVHKTLDSTVMNQFLLKEKLMGALTSSVMQGSAGPPGPPTTILDSYESVEELKKEHPEGKPGDAYLVGGVLYVWDTDANDWKGTGNLIGPQGPQGTGTTIKGSYKSLEDFEKNPPGGSPNDAYLVGSDIYIWNEASGWHSAGNLRGPQGVGTLIKGTSPSPDDLKQKHPDGPPEDAYLIDGKLYVWTKEEGWHSAGDLHGPASSSYTIIPFASTEAPFTYSNNGEPTRVTLLGFGYGDRRGEGSVIVTDLANYSIKIDPNNQSFTLSRKEKNQNKQVVFSLPFNMILKNIYITVGTSADFTFESKVCPYIQLFKADAGTNNFTKIDGAAAIPEGRIGSGFVPADTMLEASIEGMDIPLKAGTRIAIGAMMKTEESTSILSEEHYWLYFTGGIGLAYDPNPTT